MAKLRNFRRLSPTGTTGAIRRSDETPGSARISAGRRHSNPPRVWSRTISQVSLNGDQPAAFELVGDGDARTVRLTGDWTLNALDREGRRLSAALRGAPAARYDLTQVGKLDTAGAFEAATFGGAAALVFGPAAPQSKSDCRAQPHQPGLPVILPAGGSAGATEGTV